jgi:6-phosphogluconolactonase (cycloisomerase 2 family)
MTGLLGVGCGSTDDTTIAPAPTGQLREFVVIPNTGVPGTLTVKGVNLTNGTSIVLNSGVSTGGNGANVVKTQNTRNLVIVSNPGTPNIASFQMDANGGLTLLNAIPEPAGTTMLVINPFANFCYAAGGTSLQAYSIGANGQLTAVGAPVVLAGNVGQEACFSNGGNTLHVPELGVIQSFPVSLATGVIGAPVTTALAAVGDQANDLSISPAGGIIEAIVQKAGNDEARAYVVAGGVLGAVTVTALPGDFVTADFATNGQYFAGQTGIPANVRGYNVNAATGALTEFVTSPSVTPNSSINTAIDPSQQFIFSTGGGALDVRGRLADGTMSGVTSDNAGVSVASGRFDFFSSTFF